MPPLGAIPKPAKAPAGPKGPIRAPKASTPKAAPAAKPAKAKNGPPIAHGLARVANQQIHLAEEPVLQQIAAERAANLARAQSQMGFAKALASLMQQAAPNVQQGYTNAANADAGYAKGLGSIAQGALDQNTQATNSFLANMGTPDSALKQAAPVGDITYGTQGYIPATSLQREGAAFGAAANMLPGLTAAQGAQTAAATMANDPNLVSLQGELAKIAATQPDVYRQLVALAQTQKEHAIAAAQAQQRIGISQQSLNLRAQEIAATNAYHQASLGMRQEQIGLARRKDAASIALAIQKGERPDAALSKIYGYIVDGNGKAILNKQGKKITVKSSSSSSSGGLPPWATTGGGKSKNPKGAGTFGAGISPSAYHIPSAAGRAIVQLAHEYVGTPYVWGGTTPKGFDCSGFAQYLYGKANISIPRTSYEQWTAPNGHPVSKRGLQPGDLVFYKGADSIVQNGRVLPGHVGVYIGHGKIIDAFGTGYGVRVDSVFSPMMGGYMGARRYQ